MNRLLMNLRALVAVVVAVARVALRRLRRGPTCPTWTWAEEFFVAGSRAALTASAPAIGTRAPRRNALKVPLGREARQALTVGLVDVDGVPTERYCPKTSPSGTILRLHGGGFVSGSVAIERRVAAELAIASNCDTFGIGYRLAPEHPYPGALEDTITVYRALLAQGVNPATTIFFGGSAGACLALASLLKVRELELPQPAGAVLLWPYADFTFSGDTIHTNGDIDMLPVRDLAHLWGPAYVGDADPADPLVSPALADLSGVAPLLILAGGAESLLSCAERIADNARRAGVDTQFTVYPHKVHGWMMLPKIPATRQATDEIMHWIAAHLTVQS